jgi:hypothetical protein
MKIINEILETGYVKLLSGFALVIPFALDAWNKTEYYIIAFAIAVVTFVIAYYDVSKRRKLYKTEILPIPIVIAIDPNEKPKYVLNNLFRNLEAKSEFKDLKKNLKRYRNIIEDDLIFNYNGDLYDKERLISFIQLIKYQITKIKESTGNKVQFHLAYYSRPAYGFYFGYAFAQEDLVVYQQTPDKDAFEAVVNLQDRTYKNSVNEYKKFHIEKLKEDQNSDTVLFAIKASSHNIKFNSPSLQKYTNIVSMVANHDGTIQKNEDWVLYAREIFTQLQELQNKYKHVVLVHNMPESLAIIVGRATGNFWNTMITQYDRGEYKNIMQLDEIKCYF